jgi:DNA-binding transcriptional regulator GbsR (MarR family)
MLSSLQEEFILHFGEMGSRWGINRTVGQVYALLFISAKPLNAEEITGKLSISRSNTSMALKELQSWQLVVLKHFSGDRRDYFTTPGDLLDIVRTLIAERKKREIDPTLTKLRELEMQPSTGDDYGEARVAELRELIEMLTAFYDDMQKLETERLMQLMTYGSRLAGVIEKASGAMPPFLRKS